MSVSSEMVDFSDFVIDTFELNLSVGVVVVGKLVHLVDNGQPLPYHLFYNLIIHTLIFICLCICMFMCVFMCIYNMIVK